LPESACRVHDSTDGLADAVAVLGFPLKGPKNEHVECALKKIEADSGLGQ
jgi:hypothetical protein